MGNKLKVNPFNVFKARRMDFPPSHFEYANIPLNYNMNTVVGKWVEQNLKSRYYLGRAIALDDDNKTSYTLRIGFESSKELSYFMLACPYLKYK